MGGTLIGKTISHYTIVSKFGEDAAGVLYKVTDARTDRAVTLKILSSEIAGQSELRLRIERDAKAISGLQHPNIALILEWSRQDGIEFVVMETPEGETLQDLLERERPKRRNLLAYATQIAGAISASHDAGLVRGPLNPSAIVITPRNEVKIYDFGFGNLLPPAGSELERRRQFGVSAPYVSPEQAQGEAPDARSDIFSYGALVYHMTTGRLPFRGATTGETWKATVEQEPKPIAQITSRAPRGMDKLLERCLRKNPERRFQRMGEVTPLLYKLAEAFRQNPEHHVSFLSRKGTLIAKGAAIAAVVLTIVVAGAFWWKERATAEPIAGGHFRQITKDGGLATDPAISADGSHIAYASDRNGGGNLDIWVQPMGGGDPVRLTNDPADDIEPTFSPDGATVAFRSERAGGGVYTVSSKGGEARLIASEGRRPRYSPDGRWIAYWVGPRGLSTDANVGYRVFIIPTSGGAPKQIRADFASGNLPLWSPDSKRLLFVGRPDATRTDPNAIDWWTVAIDSGAVMNTETLRSFHRLGALDLSDSAIPGDWRGNHIFYSVPHPEGSNIWRTEILADGQPVEGKPLRVTKGNGIEALPSATTNGLIVYAVQSYNAEIWSLPVVANEGKVTGDLKRWTNNPGANVAPSLSADGTKLFFQSNRSGHFSVMQLDTNSGKDSPLPSGAGEQLWPLVSPDGSKVAWSELRIGRYEHLYKPTGGGSTEVLCEDCGPAVTCWSQDGRVALVESFNSTHSRLTVGMVKIGGGRPEVVLEDPSLDLRQARFSPDNGSILFLARLGGGTTRVYIAPFHDQLATPQKEWIALTNGDAWESSPQWSPDGKLVYYISTRDGFRCVWAQRLDFARNPSGPAFPVYHAHSARRAPAILPFNSTDLFVAHNQIVLSLGELTGEIWSAKVSQ
jgi:Tol biopolymer transport system component